MENVIIIGLLVIILSLAAFYVYKSKKKGCKCVGCPHAQECVTKIKQNCCKK